MRQHGFKDYAALPDIDTSSAGILTAGDCACLDELGRCLVGADVHERFGATLLHSHFPIRDDEILIEEAHENAQLITLRPISSVAADLIATSVLFEGRHDGFGLVGLEYASEATLAGVRPFGDQDYDVLARVREIFERHGKVGRFGIRLLHAPLRLGARVLLETCDHTSRVLTCRTTTEDDPNFTRAIATFFYWEAGWADGRLAASQGCMQFCKSSRRCVVSRRGHQSSSTHDKSHDDRF